MPKKTNLFYRVITGILFIPALIYITSAGKFYYLIFIELGIGIGVYEFYKILETRGLKPFKTIGITAALLLGWNAYYASYIFTLSTLTALFLILSISELFRRNPDRAIFHISSTIFGVIYVGWFMSHCILLRQLPLHLSAQNPAYLREYGMGFSLAFLPFVIAWTNDIFAYFIGTKFGKKRILKRISPSKTIGGFVGGGVFGIIAIFVFNAFGFTPYLSIWHCLVLGLLGSLAAQTGDLIESLLKRDAELKDVSTTIPGHGGFLDRFDSILFTAPVVYYYLRFIFK